MKISRKAAAVLGAAAAAAVAASPLTAVAAVPSFPTQGDAIYTEGHGMCTLGYNDHTKGVSYVAAHCGSEGARVSMFNSVTEEFGEEIGTFHPSNAYDPSSFSNDWATIVWDRGVKMGRNKYSGDKVIPLASVKRGDKVCHHGETTHAGTDRINCGTYYDRIGQSFAVSMESGQSGDSGGPVWVDGKGFLGVASAVGQTFAGNGPGQAFLAAAPKDGVRFSAQDLLLLSARASGSIPEGWPVVTTFPPVNTPPGQPAASAQPTGEPTPPTTTTVAPPSDNSSASSSDSSDRSDSTSSSSEMSDLQIAMIVISVLVTVLPIIAQLAQSFL